MTFCGEKSALMMSTNCVIRALFARKLRAVPAPELRYSIYRSALNPWNRPVLFLFLRPESRKPASNAVVFTNPLGRAHGKFLESGVYFHN
jgi:hypothetical protein